MPQVISRNELPFETVSVTGGTGTVGSQFVKVLLAQFPHVERIHTTCRPGSAQAHRVPDDPRVNVLRGSLEDMDILRTVVDDAEIVFHLAAWLANTDMPPMTSVYVTNSLAPAVLAKMCADAGKRMIFTSSHSVYFAGPYEGRITEEFPFRSDFVEWIDTVRGDYYALTDELIAGRKTFADIPAAVDSIHERLLAPFDPKIYDRDEYHLYCLTKLLAERFVLDHGGVVLRLSNVYGPGDESTQAVGEACQRVLGVPTASCRRGVPPAADPAVELEIRQPFKKLVPAHLGDIIRCLVRSATLPLDEGINPVFTVASQEDYLREDALLRTVADALTEIRGQNVEYRIEKLPPEKKKAFTYDLTAMRTHLLPGETLTPFRDGVKAQLAWLIDRAEGRAPAGEALSIEFTKSR